MFMCCGNLCWVYWLAFIVTVFDVVCCQFPSISWWKHLKNFQRFRIILWYYYILNSNSDVSCFMGFIQPLVLIIIHGFRYIPFLKMTLGVLDQSIQPSRFYCDDTYGIHQSNPLHRHRLCMYLCYHLPMLLLSHRHFQDPQLYYTTSSWSPLSFFFVSGMYLLVFQ